jgi:DNA-binding NarL/FixJ family response regulator
MDTALLGPESLTTRYRALVVEDSRVSMRAVANVIALQPGVKVAGMAWDGNDGLELARTLQPDIVFADLEMPGKNGLELVEILRREMPASKLVVISVHEGSVWENLSLTRGADAFVSKADLAERLPSLMRQLFPDLVSYTPAIEPPQSDTTASPEL